MMKSFIHNLASHIADATRVDHDSYSLREQRIHWTAHEDALNEVLKLIDKNPSMDELRNQVYLVRALMFQHKIEVMAQEMAAA